MRRVVIVGMGNILELHDLDTNELKMSIDHCPKIFNDFDIGSEFYINYNSNDN